MEKTSYQIDSERIEQPPTSELESQLRDRTRNRIRARRGEDIYRDDRPVEALLRGLCEGVRCSELEDVGRETGREARRDPRSARELADRLDEAAKLLRTFNRSMAR